MTHARTTTRRGDLAFRCHATRSDPRARRGGPATAGGASSPTRSSRSSTSGARPRRRRVAAPTKLALMPLLALAVLVRRTRRALRHALHALLLTAIALSWLGDGAGTFFPVAPHAADDAALLRPRAPLLHLAVLARLAVRRCRRGRRCTRCGGSCSSRCCGRILGGLAIAVAVYGLVLGGTARGRARCHPLDRVGRRVLPQLRHDPRLPPLHCPTPCPTGRARSSCSPTALGQGLIAAGILVGARRAAAERPALQETDASRPRRRVALGRARLQDPLGRDDGVPRWPCARERRAGEGRAAGPPRRRAARPHRGVRRHPGRAQPISKRVGAAVVAEAVEDRTPPPPPREVTAVPVRDRGAGRPTKRERRDIDRLRGPRCRQADSAARSSSHRVRAPVAAASVTRLRSPRSLVTTVTVRPSATSRAACATISSSPDASAATTRHGRRSLGRASRLAFDDDRPPRGTRSWRGGRGSRHPGHRRSSRRGGRSVAPPPLRDPSTSRRAPSRRRSPHRPRPRDARRAAGAGRSTRSANPGCSGSRSTSSIGTQASAWLSGSLITRLERRRRRRRPVSRSVQTPRSSTLENRGTDRTRGNAGLLGRFAQRAVACRLTLVTGAAGERPGVAEVAPGHPVLKQHAPLGIEREKPRGPEPAPVLLTRVGATTHASPGSRGPSGRRGSPGPGGSIVTPPPCHTRIRTRAAPSRELTEVARSPAPKRAVSVSSRANGSPTHGQAVRRGRRG